MDEGKKFKIYAASLFSFIGVISVLEIFNPTLFAEFFMTISNHVSWILALTVGMVIPNILRRLQAGAFGRRFSPKIEERFVMFLANAAILAFIISVTQGIIIIFLRDYFEYFHIILTQWLVLVYIWFKFMNGFKISARYVITTESILIIFTSVLLFSLK